MSELTLKGHAGNIYVREWSIPSPRYLAIIIHGYGEHIGRYNELASKLNADGAIVVGPDHLGHGRSDGERVMLPDMEAITHDVRLVIRDAQTRHPNLKTVVIGHSMGGLIAARYLQRYGEELACAILSGPLLSSEGLVDYLLSLDVIPDTPLDPAALSRDASVGEAYAADPLVWHGAFKRVTAQSFKTSLELIRTGPSLPCPTIHLHGSDDPLVSSVNSAKVFAQIKGSDGESKVYDGARHEIFNETNREEVFSDVISWINRFV